MGASKYDYAGCLRRGKLICLTLGMLSWSTVHRGIAQPRDLKHLRSFQGRHIPLPVMHLVLVQQSWLKWVAWIWATIIGCDMWHTVWLPMTSRQGSNWDKQSPCWRQHCHMTLIRIVSPLGSNVPGWFVRRENEGELNTTHHNQPMVERVRHFASIMWLSATHYPWTHAWHMHTHTHL